LGVPDFSFLIEAATRLIKRIIFQIIILIFPLDKLRFMHGIVVYKKTSDPRQEIQDTPVCQVTGFDLKIVY